MSEWRVIAWAEPLVVIAIAPFLLFPALRPTWTAAGLALLIIVWVARWVIRRETWPVTPFNAALLLFCLCIPVATMVSATPDLTLPKLTGLILGLAGFRVIVFAASPGRPLAVATGIVLAVGLGMWEIGVLGMRIGFLAPLVQRLPGALASLPGAPDQGINPNQLAGLLVLYLPFVMALALLALRRRKLVLGVGLALVALAAVGTLVFTKSRAGWVGFAVAILGLGLMLAVFEGSRRTKRLALGGALAVLVLAVVAVAVLLSHPPGSAASSTAGRSAVSEILGQLTLDQRVEIWSRALYALQDFPFTGVGLGTFRSVVNILYPLFLVAPGDDIAHAHNIFLQVGVDLGLGGLIAYVALLLVGFVAAWEVARGNAGNRRYLALGLLASLIGLHVYGLADAVALGSKPGLAFWMIMGLLAALASSSPAPSVARDPADSETELPVATPNLGG